MNILEPTAPLGKAPASSWKPLEDLAGKVIGFIDNSKPNFNVLADDLAALLVERYGVASVVRHRKLAASIPAPDTTYADVAEKCDLLIAGSGD